MFENYDKDVLKHFCLLDGRLTVKNFANIWEIAKDIQNLEEVPAWTYNQSVEYLRLLFLGFATTPIIYYLNKEHEMFVFKGYNQLMAIKHLLSNELEFIENDIFISSSSKKIVCFNEVKDNYYRNLLMDDIYVPIYQLSGPEDKLEKYGWLKLVDMFRKY